MFKTPNNHPRSQPFVDHILNFAITTDEKIWLRNYQIVNDAVQLEEIGNYLNLFFIIKLKKS